MVRGARANSLKSHVVDGVEGPGGFEVDPGIGEMEAGPNPHVPEPAPAPQAFVPPCQEKGLGLLHDLPVCADFVTRAVADLHCRTPCAVAHIHFRHTLRIRRKSGVWKWRRRLVDSDLILDYYTQDLIWRNPDAQAWAS